MLKALVAIILLCALSACSTYKAPDASDFFRMQETTCKPGGA